MRSRLLVPVLALPLALLSTGCSSLTRPDEIRIVESVMPSLEAPAGAQAEPPGQPAAARRPLPPTPGGG